MSKTVYTVTFYDEGGSVIGVRYTLTQARVLAREDAKRYHAGQVFWDEVVEAQPDTESYKNGLRRYWSGAAGRYSYQIEEWEVPEPSLRVTTTFV